MDNYARRPVRYGGDSDHDLGGAGLDEMPQPHTVFLGSLVLIVGLIALVVLSPLRLFSGARRP
jgi:hypothetical protein